VALCGCCGKELEGLVSNFGYLRPIHYFMVPEAEREARVEADDDLCVIDGEVFLIRAVMRVPILGASATPYFGWGFWVAVSERTFRRYLELFAADGSSEPVHEGLLAASAPTYPDALDAPVAVQFGSASQRPALLPKRFDNPLFVEARDGITVQRWHQLVAGIEAWQAERE
jgi:hypothetical protein